MRAILFDVDGVLIQGYHSRPELRIWWDEDIEKDLGIDRQKFKDEFFGSPVFKQIIIGQKDLHEALTQSLALMGYQITAQDVIDYWLHKDSNINHRLLENIVALKDSGNVRLFLATNQEHNRSAYLMNSLGFSQYFEDCFHSARIGVAKPDRRYFEKVAQLLGPQEEPPIFFDDTPAVVEAANQFGWEAHEFCHAEDIKKSGFIAHLLAS